MKPRISLFLLAQWLAVAPILHAEIELRGVSLAGAEFGNTFPGVHGVDYSYPGQEEVDYFRSKDMNVIRLPFRWERLQPVENGGFDAAELARLKGFVDATTAKRVRVILDVHNYARHFDRVIGSPELPNSAFADFCSRLGSEFGGNPLVIYGLMNEPNNMPTEQWVSAANAGIAALRGAGAGQMVLVCGNAWSGGWSWSQGWYGTPNSVAMLGITDPAENFAFEIHQYLDSDSSGTSATAVSATVGSERLAGVTSWLREHGKRGFLGEFGAGTDPVSLAAVDDLLEFLGENDDVWLGWTWWAGGPWWPSNYPFLLRPTAQGADRPQMAVLLEYLPILVPAVSYDRPNQRLEFLSSPGHHYRTWVSGTLGGGWQALGSSVEGTGGGMFLPAPDDGPARFYRVEVTRP
jgi:endoglucanase